MERLTIDTKLLFCDIAQCRETPGGSFCEDGYCDQRRCYERLREYERKGLSPEDVPTGLELAEVYSVIRLLKQYEALGTIADLTALVKSRDDGRVVALPCKMGEAIYIRDSQGNLLEMTADAVAIMDSDGDANLLDWFGKTVFLTRAEADAALGGGENAT